MANVILPTARLDLVLETTAAVLARIEAMTPADRAEVSPAWLAQLQASAPDDPWTHGFAMIERTSGANVGSCAYTGPPSPEGSVEIAYGVEPSHRGLGYATEAAAALVAFASAVGSVRRVSARTRPEHNASTRVLTKCGFVRVGEVVDPIDGLVWEWVRAPAQGR